MLDKQVSAQLYNLSLPLTVSALLGRIFTWTNKKNTLIYVNTFIKQKQP